MPEPQSRRGVASWVVYDLANTIFSFNIVSLYYALWVKDQFPDDTRVGDAVFAAGNFLSMGVVFVLAPALGALSDRARRRIPFLVATTIFCVLMTLPLGVLGWRASITLFALANIGFQSGLIFYDALLADVSTPRTVGRVGALGVGVGYLGSLGGLGLGASMLAGGIDEAWIFAATGLAFLLFALPSFFWVREPVRAAAGLSFAQARAAAAASFRGLAGLLRGREHAPVRRFLIGRVFYTDAANTMIIFMAIYATEEAGFTTQSVQGVLLAGILGAAGAAYLWGLLVDRVGPKHTLDLVLLAWMVGLLVVVLIPILDLPPGVFYLAAFWLGAALGGTWAADRPLMLALAPPERLGEFYGYYAMVGRFAAILGPVLWFLIVHPNVLDQGRPVAVLSLLVFMVAAFAILRRLVDPHHPHANPLARIQPWGDGSGRRPGPLWRMPLRAPFLLAFLAASWALFWPLAERRGRFWFTDADQLDAYAYAIPDLTQDLPHAVLTLATAPFLNHDSVQLVYVTGLLVLFGLAFEAREGTRRTLLLFFGTTVAGALVAGLLLHVLYPGLTEAAFFERAWNRTWSGGSVGAFGLMGALAARARNPWPLFAFFVFWELNVGWWFLQSYTPFFHLTALVVGFAWTRGALAPIREAAPA